MRIAKRLILALTVILLLLFAGSSVYHKFIVDREPPVISGPSDVLEISAEGDESQLLSGLTATDNADGDLTKDIIIQKISYLISAQTAEVTYNVFDSSNNMGTFTRKVHYTDYRSPRINLTKPLIYELGKSITLSDRIEVDDMLDGDLSDRITINAGELVTTSPGAYPITVSVSNSAGDRVNLPLTVIITSASKTAPSFQLTDYLVYVKAGEDVDEKSYIDKLNDPVKSDESTSNIEIISEADYDTPGIYEVIYTYSSTSGNYTAVLTVVVE